MPHTKRAFEALDKSIEGIKIEAKNPKSLLYIGWRSDASPWWHDKFCKELGIEKIAVLEIFPPNFQNLEREVAKGRYKVKPILGDARQLNQYVAPEEYDVIFWDHGPEHVTLSDLQKATPMLGAMAGRMLLYCCPWGEWSQGPEGSNLDEEHKNYVTPEQLIPMGLHVMTFGGSGQAAEGELIAVYVKK